MVKGGRAKVVGVCMSRDISNPPVLLHVIKQSVQSVWDSTVSKGGRTDGASPRFAQPRELSLLYPEESE